MLRPLLILVALAARPAHAEGDRASSSGEADLPTPGAGLTFERVELGPRETAFTLRESGSEQRLGLLRIHSHAAEGERVTGDGAGIQLEWWQGDRSRLGALVGAGEALAGRHGGWAPKPSVTIPPLWPVAFAWGLLLPLAALARLRRLPISLDLRVVHVIPALVQTSIFAYWAAWWAPLLAHLPTIVAQLGLAYFLDGALSLALRRRWVVGFAPIPVVLSISLFLWFGVAASALVVAVALVAKVLFVRQGKHWLNPSAAALAFTGLVVTIVPAFGSYEPLFHTMNLAPWMGEWVLLAALIPQLRLPIVLVTLGALLGYTFSGVLGPGPALMRPATILAFALLATDPATIPRTPGGRLLFGLVFGVGVRVASIGLLALGQPDDLSKVLPLPLCNFFTARFDTVAARFDLGRWLRPEHNRWHVAAWFVVAAHALWLEKGQNFEAALHWSYATPGVEIGASGAPDCAANPSYCAGFGIPNPVNVERPGGRGSEGAPRPAR